MPSIPNRTDRSAAISIASLAAVVLAAMSCSQALGEVVAKAHASIDWSSLAISYHGPSSSRPLPLLSGITQSYATWNGAEVDDDEAFSSTHPVATSVAEIGGSRAAGMIHGSSIVADSLVAGPSGVLFHGSAETDSGISWAFTAPRLPIPLRVVLTVSFRYELSVALRTDALGDAAGAQADIALTVGGGPGPTGPTLTLHRTASDGRDVGPLTKQGTAHFTFVFRLPTTGPATSLYRFNLTANAASVATSVPSAGPTALGMVATVMASRRRRSRSG